MMRLRLRRKRFVVDRRLQSHLLIISLSYVVFFISVLGFALFAPLIFKLNDSTLQSTEIVEAAQSILYLHHKFWPAVLLTFIAIGLHSIRTSHRIAGPLFRFRQVFDAVKNGVIPTPPPLRKGDYLHAEMHAVNEMLEGLRQKLGEIQEAQTSLCQSIAEYSALTDIAPASLRQLTTDLIAKGDQLARKIRQFRI